MGDQILYSLLESVNTSLVPTSVRLSVVSPRTVLAWTDEYPVTWPEA